MAKIEQTATRLDITMGMPKFNGSVVSIDQGTGRAQFNVTNLFFRSKPLDVALSDIAGIEIKRQRRIGWPVVVLKSGERHSLACVAGDAEKVVPVMQAFLQSRGTA